MKYTLRIIAPPAYGTITLGTFADYADAKALADAVVALSAKAEKAPALRIKIWAEDVISVEGKPKKETEE